MTEVIEPYYGHLNTSTLHSGKVLGNIFRG